MLIQPNKRSRNCDNLTKNKKAIRGKKQGNNQKLSNEIKVSDHKIKERRTLQNPRNEMEQEVRVGLPAS